MLDTEPFEERYAILSLAIESDHPALVSPRFFSAS
jgi:hypothetical protein